MSNEQSKTLTLAEKAREMRSRDEEGEKETSKGRRFETLASRAQRKRSPSPEPARQEGRARSPPRKAGGPVFSRLGPKF